MDDSAQALLRAIATARAANSLAPQPANNGGTPTALVLSDDQRVEELRIAVEQAIYERRVLVIRYAKDASQALVQRAVEPLAQSYVGETWSFLAYCRLRRELRSFRHDRCLSFKLTDQVFETREGVTLERYIQRHKALERGPRTNAR